MAGPCGDVERLGAGLKRDRLQRLFHVIDVLQNMAIAVALALARELAQGGGLYVIKLHT